MQMNAPITFTDAWQGISNCRECAIRESALFSGLQESDFGSIHQGIEQIQLDPGEHLYRATDNGSDVFTVRSGLIKLSHTFASGDQRIVRLVKTAELTGMESLLAKPYEQDAIALQYSEVCRIPGALVNELVQSNSNLYQSLMERYQQTLTKSERWISDFSTGSAKKRFARLLLCMVETSVDGQCQLTRREDIADILGLTVETTSRTIAEFKRQGYVSEEKRKYFTCDVAALESISNDE